MTIPCGEIHHGNKQLIHDCQRKKKIPEPLDDNQLQIKANELYYYIKENATAKIIIFVGQHCAHCTQTNRFPPRRSL